MGSVAPAMARHVDRWRTIGPNTTNSGIAPGDPKQGGYHQSRKDLIRLGRTGDYSNRLPWDVNGPGDRFRAHDRGMPNQATISRYMRYVRDAYYIKDPRLTGWREFLGAIDGTLIGFNTTPNDFYTRTPDSSHYTHIHESIFDVFVDEEWPYTNIESVYRGESLEYYRRNDGMAEFTDRLAKQIENADTYLWRALTQLDDEVTGINGPADGKVENKFAKELKAIRSDATAARTGVQAVTEALEVVKGMLSAPTPVQIDASAVASALKNDPDFLGALANAINDDAARRMAE